MKKIILVTGGSGLVGKYLKTILPNAIYISSKDFNLTNEKEVITLFKKHKPNVVIHLAAKVGGIIDNINNPAIYLDENVLMNTLLLKYSKVYNVERFLGILSTCIYPDVSERYPLLESDLHLGPPTISNFSYGYSKRLMSIQIDSYNSQYGTKYNYIIPCNLYGENDKDDVEKSHFVTALIKKIFDAKQKKEKKITLFGDGTPIRQFMHANDLANIIKKIIDEDIIDNFNIATDEIYSIKEITKIALNSCDANDLIVEWDVNKPNGQFRKDVSIKKMKTIIGDYKFIKLQEGIKQVYKSYYDKISK
jgi:GDP-L-fucose synthase